MVEVISNTNDNNIAVLLKILLIFKIMVPFRRRVLVSSIKRRELYGLVPFDCRPLPVFGEWMDFVSLFAVIDSVGDSAVVGFANGVGITLGKLKLFTISFGYNLSFKESALISLARM